MLSQRYVVSTRSMLSLVITFVLPGVRSLSSLTVFASSLPLTLLRPPPQAKERASLDLSPVLMAHRVKNPPAVQETQVQSLGG